MLELQVTQEHNEGMLKGAVSQFVVRGVLAFTNKPVFRCFLESLSQPSSRYLRHQVLVMGISGDAIVQIITAVCSRTRLRGPVKDHR